MQSPKFQEGQRVAIRMLGHESLLDIVGGRLVSHLDVQDAGTGIVLAHHYEPAVEQHQYQVAVITGRLDVHRNDLGELWVNESELDEAAD